MEIDWAKFLGRPQVAVDAALAESAVRDECVLITGAGGSIGSGLVEAALMGRPRKLVLLDSSEHALYETLRRVAPRRQRLSFEVVPVVGGAGDREAVRHVLQQHSVDLVVHTAAYKHVPLMEQNPFAAIANNSIGTYRLLTAALDAGVRQLVMVSTDKAVNPQSMMGVSKRIAEMVVLSHSTLGLRMSAVRLGNVLGSSGSVVPVFKEQAGSGLPLTVTHADAERYFVTLAEAEAAILTAAASDVAGKILIADCGEAFRILDLARFVAQQIRPGMDPVIEFMGLRRGDKLREELVAADEQVEAGTTGGIRVVSSPVPSAKVVAAAIWQLESAVDSFDHEKLHSILTAIVPSYRSSLPEVSDRAIAEVR